MEIYHRDKVESVVFHGPPTCKQGCAGCYLKPHAERWQILSQDKKAKSLGLFNQAYRDLTLGAKNAIRSNQVIYCANGISDLNHISRVLLQAPARSDVGRLLLASAKTWSDIRSLPAKYEQPIIGTASCLSMVSVDEFKLEGTETVSQYLTNLASPSMIKAFYPFMRPYIAHLLWTPKVAADFRDKPWNNPNIFLYLIMHKPICGEEPSSWQIKQALDLLRWYHKFGPASNCQLDYCLNHLSSNSDLGCRAGINIFNIHANGDITGCPYSATPKANLKDFNGNVSDAIRHVRELANSDRDYDWNYCKFRNYRDRFCKVAYAS